MSTKTKVTDASRYRKNTGQTKRWYFDATIGKNVPIIGGTGFKIGDGKLNKRSVAALVKREITNSLEYKRKLIVNGSLGAAVHNTIYTFNPLGNIPIGTGSGSRIGSQIDLEHVKMKMIFTNFAAVNLNECHYRVIWVKSTANVQQSTDAFGSGLGSTDIFEQGSTLLATSIVDKNKVVVLSDTIIDLKPTVATAGLHTAVYHNNDLTLKFKMKYATPTSNYSDKYNLYCVVIPYLVGGVTGTTIVGTTQWEACVGFHDS